MSAYLLKIKAALFASLLMCSIHSFAKCYEDVDKFKGDARYWCGAWGTGGEMLGGLFGVDPIPHFVVVDGKSRLILKLVIDQPRLLHIKAGDALIFITKSGQKITLHAESDGVRNARPESAPGAMETASTTASDLLAILSGATPNAGVTNTPQNAVTNEYANYPITLEQLNTLAMAEQLDFAAYIDGQRIERKMEKMQLALYQEFLTKVIAVHGGDASFESEEKN